MFGDVVKLLVWGADNQSVARPPGLEGTFAGLRRPVPSYQVFVLIPIGSYRRGTLPPADHTQIGNVVRAATQDREMLARSGSTFACSIPGVRRRRFLAASAVLCGAMARFIRHGLRRHHRDLPGGRCWGRFGRWRAPRSAP